MKLYLKVTLAVFAVLGLTSSFAFAASDTISGTVGVVNTITIVENAGVLGDLGTAGNTDVEVADITINNNDPDGFIVTIAGAGKLIRAATPGTNLGDFINYTMGLTAGSGILGVTEPTLPSGVDLGAGDSVTTFDGGAGSPTQATSSKIYKMTFTTSAKPTLLNGTFSDTITVTIANV